MSRYIAAYDVADDRIRSRIARLLEGYGHRLQESVFEVWVEPEELPVFRRSVGSLLGGKDLFDLVPIDTRPQRVRLRWMQPLDSDESVIVLE